MSLLLLLVPAAQAVYYSGNPALGFTVDRPAHDYLEGSVDLLGVRVHHCGGGTTDYVVNKTVDPVAGYEIVISGGDHCGVTWFWDSTMVIEGSGFTVEYTGSSVYVPLADPISPKQLTPYSVTDGTMTGGGPWIETYVD